MRFSGDHVLDPILESCREANFELIREALEESDLGSKTVSHLSILEGLEPALACIRSLYEVFRCRLSSSCLEYGCRAESSITHSNCYVYANMAYDPGFGPTPTPGMSPYDLTCLLCLALPLCGAWSLVSVTHQNYPSFIVITIRFIAGSWQWSLVVSTSALHSQTYISRSHHHQNIHCHVGSSHWEHGHEPHQGAWIRRPAGLAPRRWPSAHPRCPFLAPPTPDVKLAITCGVRG